MDFKIKGNKKHKRLYISALDFWKYIYMFITTALTSLLFTILFVYLTPFWPLYMWNSHVTSRFPTCFGSPNFKCKRIFGSLVLSNQVLAVFSLRSRVLFVPMITLVPSFPLAPVFPAPSDCEDISVGVSMYLITELTPRILETSRLVYSELFCMREDWQVYLQPNRKSSPPQFNLHTENTSNYQPPRGWQLLY